MPISAVDNFENQELLPGGFHLRAKIMGLTEPPYVFMPVAFAPTLTPLSNLRHEKLMNVFHDSVIDANTFTKSAGIKMCIHVAIGRESIITRHYRQRFQNTFICRYKICHYKANDS